MHTFITSHACVLFVLYRALSHRAGTLKNPLLLVVVLNVYTCTVVSLIVVIKDSLDSEMHFKAVPFIYCCSCTMLV